MDFVRYSYIALGGLTIIVSICGFLRFATSLFIAKRIRQVLSESECKAYQKSQAVLYAFLGTVYLILGITSFYADYSFVYWMERTGYFAFICIALIGSMIINKKYIGHCSPKSLDRKKYK